METMARQLQRLSASRDWPALAMLDRKVAALLAGLPPRSGWSARERAAFEALQRAHGEVRELCAAETQRIGAQLEDMRRHRQGWVAYALMELEEAI
jgi:hypothetical protein